MIIIRLAGGLGNQIFQLGAGLFLANQGGHQTIMIDDSSLTKYSIVRTNKLTFFFDLKACPYNIVYKRTLRTIFRTSRVLPLKIKKWPFVSDRNFQTIIADRQPRLRILDGYFQTCLSQKVFDAIRDLLAILLVFPCNTRNNDSTCAVHIRGGDFIQLGRTRVAPPEFYFKSMDIMVKKYNIKKFKVVTDDHDYARTIMHKSPFPYTYSHGDIVSDFHEIARHSKRILSSSTFSLWASALGDNRNGIVLAPKFWFPGQKREIYLPNELRIPESST